jgi:hypothetical protein
MPWLEFRDQLTAFAQEVMPAFTGRSAPEVAEVAGGGDGSGS